MNPTRAAARITPAAAVAAVLACAAGAGAGPVTSDTLRVAPDAGLYYEVQGAGEPVVLIHGGFGDRRMWDDQFDVLAKEFRVVRYDHRGFGRSTPPDTTYSPARDLEMLLDHLDMDSAHVVGNSLGGSFAIAFALLHPERVRSLTVVAASADGYKYPQADIDSIMAVIETMQAGRAEEALQRWLANPMLAVANTMPAVRERVHRMVRDNARIWTMSAWPEERFDPPASRRLGELDVPTLILIGDRDAASVRLFADSTAQGIPGAGRHVMEGTDHLPQMEKPAEFNRVLLTFLRSH
jgi:pimeloyl-ACP methyl ester carboxylesterase